MSYIRRCQICHDKKLTKELFRWIFYKKEDGRIELDLEKKKQGGQGFYVCSSYPCLHQLCSGKKYKKRFWSKMDSQAKDWLIKTLDCMGEDQR